jgi:hypothetical protein
MGPASLPAKPGIPTPEFCALGIVTFALLVRAKAGSAVIVSATTIPLTIVFVFMVPTSQFALPTWNVPEDSGVPALLKFKVPSVGV